MTIFEQIIEQAAEHRAVIDANYKPPAPMVMDYREQTVAHNVHRDALTLFNLSDNSIAVTARYSGCTDSAVSGWLNGMQPKPATLERIRKGIKRLKKIKEKKAKRE